MATDETKKKVRALIAGLVLATVTLSVSLGLTLFNRSSSRALNVYSKHVEDYIPVSIEEIEKKVDNGDEFFVYVGLNSCKDCQAFAQKLHTAVNTLDSVDIYYKGFTKESMLTSEESSYLTELMGGNDLPFFAWVSKGGKVSELENTKDTTVLNIKDFIHYVHE